MGVKYEYSRKRDVWAIEHFGGGTRFLSRPTTIWLAIAEMYGTNPSKQQISDFIEHYITQHSVDIEQFCSDRQHEWDSIAERFTTRAESVFGVSLPHAISGHPTVGERGPYNIDNNFFMVSIHGRAPIASTMHELWHFYTWYALGPDEEKRIGQQPYNDIKECLTILLNTECADLMPLGVIDAGYPQHQQLRAHVQEVWNTEHDIKHVWEDALRTYLNS